MGDANHLVARLLARGEDAAPFLVAQPGGAQRTYGDLRAQVRAMAGAMAAAGVAPGDRVAARIAKSPEGLALYLATVSAGAVFLPLNTAYAPAEIAYFLADAEPGLVVCDPSEVDMVRGAGARTVLTLDAAGAGSLAEAAARATPADPVARGPDDLAAILYTSGTTGRSKGAMITHANLVSNAEALADIWRFTAQDRLLHALPTYHTHGLFTAVNTMLAAGASLVFLPRFEPEAVLEALPLSTAMMGVPTFYTRLLDHPGFTREACASVRLFVSGSAPLLAETHRRFLERTGHAILERYGMTETGMNASNPHDGERRPGTVGFALPDVTIRVVDQAGGAECPPGAIGMIEVKGPNVFAGYWRNPEKTAAEMRADGFFVTGDLGALDEAGRLTITGRGKDLVISGGFNVFPKEVELEIDALDGVAESAVVGAPHPDLGEGVVAVVVMAPDRALDEVSLRAALEGRLARYKWPKRIVAVDALPRNSMGKVQKALLRERFRDIFGETI